METHDFSALPESQYAYLLGLYLGDGCISKAKRGVYCLRITLDAKYPQIISECQGALTLSFPRRERTPDGAANHDAWMSRCGPSTGRV